MTVHWTQNALRHLAAVHEYIAQNSGRYAQGMVDRITRRTEHRSRNAKRPAAGLPAAGRLRQFGCRSPKR